MVFKLVRTDTSEPCKIKLPVGTHLIGRGQLLVCEDKRVSRHHGELEVTKDSVSIKSLHCNPCFYIRKSTDNMQILKQESTINLSHGDKFGFLPCKYWYELIYITSEDPASTTDIATKVNTDNANMEDDNTTNGSTVDTQPYDAFEKDTTVSQPLNSDLNETVEKEPNMSQPLNFELNETDGNVAEGPGSPSLICDAMDNQISSRGNDDNPSVSSHHSGEARMVKRSNSTASDDTSPVNLKKVKTESDDTKDVKPGPSNDQAVSSDDKKDDGVQSPLVKPPARERCIYGANCYRRNPQHKAQFSHPQDSDWGTGERGECPYGASCRRRDPRHWLHHTHPHQQLPDPDLDPYQAARPGMRVVQRHGNIFYINAHSVNFHDDHFDVADSDGDSVDFDYEF